MRSLMERVLSGRRVYQHTSDALICLVFTWSILIILEETIA